MSQLLMSIIRDPCINYYFSETFLKKWSCVAFTIGGDEVGAKVNNEDDIGGRQLLLLERFPVFQNAAFNGHAPQLGHFGANTLQVQTDRVHLHHKNGLVGQETVAVTFFF
jgi:hypothetical protein